MAKKSPETSGSPIVGIAMIAALGIGALAAQGENTSAEPRHNAKITTDTTASVRAVEKDFNCDLQQGEHRPSSAQVKCAQAVAAAMGKHSFGWKKNQQDCLVDLWTRESNWSSTADNPTSTAYGIPQGMTNGMHNDTMPDDYSDNIVSQIAWGLDYIKGRYGEPCDALNFWQNIAPSKPPYNGHWY